MRFPRIAFCHVKFRQFRVTHTQIHYKHCILTIVVNIVYVNKTKFEFPATAVEKNVERLKWPAVADFLSIPFLPMLVLDTLMQNKMWPI